MNSERINEKTINGGDYSEIFYFDNDMNPIEKAKAIKAIIRECKENGELVQENFFIITHDKM